MLLAHNIVFDSGAIVQRAEFQQDPVLAINLSVSRLSLDEKVETLDATMHQYKEFQVQFEAG